MATANEAATQEDGENFVRWIEANIFRSNEMDDWDWAQIAKIAQPEFPMLVVDANLIKTTTWAICRHKNKKGL